MLSRRNGRFVLRLGLAALLVVAVGWVGAKFLAKLGLERFQGDAARMAKLRTAPLLTIPAAPVQSGDWPQWRGPNRDGVSLESGLLTNWPPEGPRVLWRKPLDCGFSSLAVAGGRLYTMVQEAAAEKGDVADSSPIHEAVVCWDAATGDELWRFRYPNQYDERFGAGPRSTPAVDEGHVYTVGPTGIFHCLRADTGAVVWRHDLLQEFGASVPRYGMAFSPLVEGDLVYTMPGGPDGGAVAAFDKHDGRLVWKALSDPVGYSSPIAATLAGVRQVLFLTNTALVSLAPRDGRELWRHPWETKDGFNIATPIVFGDYVFVSSAYGKGCTLLEVSVAADGSPRAAVVYEHNRMRNYFASSVLYEGHVYGFDNTSLACMDVRSGKIVWREADERKYKKGSFLIADGQLIVLGEYGRLALAAATPEGYHEKASFSVSRHKCWTVPVLAGGKLYVRDQSSLVCLDLKDN